MTNTTAFNAGENRYEIHVDDVLAGFVEVREDDDTVDMLHTEVFDQFEGQGVAGRLVAAALDDVRERGKKVVATCPYVGRYVSKHPEYADLLA